MARLICILPFLIVVFLTIESRGGNVWSESFDIPNKGYWGDADGTTLHSDVDGISKWQVDISSCQLTAENDYVKTTSTSGGRFEVVDCDGEAIWTSEHIAISNFKKVSIRMNVRETGSGANTANKYVKVYYQVDDHPKELLEINGACEGNFGALVASQSDLYGDHLRIIVILNTGYASDKLIIDDIHVDGESKITYSSNHIDSVEVVSENQLRIVFAEELLASSVIADNFQMQDDFGLLVQTVSIVRPDSIPNTVCITTMQQPTGNIQLITSGLQDIGGLPMKDETYLFEWFVPLSFHAVVISEIMPDPSPSVALPEYEYVEIFNRSSSPVSLKHLLLKINTKTLHLSDLILPANDYALLTSEEAVEYFPKAVVVSKFSALTNGRGKIELLTEDAKIIDSLSYSSDWYRDESKEDGGWSLERIDNNRFCDPANNWEVSTNSSGGTPGFENAVKRNNIDQLPAWIKTVRIISASQLDVFFTENIGSEWISNPANYFISDSNISPDSLCVISGKQVSLFFNPNFISGSTYKLEMKEMVDLCGNVSINRSKKFHFYLPEKHSLIFTEVFADPVPSIGLPEYEYIEIYNRSDYCISLDNIDLLVDSKISTLKDYELPSHSFIALTSEEGASFIENSIAVPSFPSLRNSSATLQLIWNNDTIDKFTYYSEWYHDDEKEEGGWSLERIDFNRFCGSKENWIASISPVGGTPGFENSVAGENQDDLPPEIVDCGLITANTIHLSFSEDIIPDQLCARTNYSLNQGMGLPLTVKVLSSAEVELVFSDNLLPNISYVLSVSGLWDECGNIMEKQMLPLERIELAAEDLLISEVLFNPYPSGCDFVEIYNYSKKIVNLNKLFLGNRDVDRNINNICVISDKNWWLYPNNFALLTKDSMAVVSLYYTSCPECFCEMNKFPSYPDKEGTVVLLDDSLQIIDEFSYSEKMHQPLLEDVEGVSLERLSDELPTNDPSNWISAAASVGFATPGYENSQQKDDRIVDATVAVSPESFSPNNDGYNDRLFIHYQMERPGFLANVRIYDSGGQLINDLVKNETIAQNGEWCWNGEKADQTRAPLGIYIIWVELFDLDGQVETYKKVCTLTDRF